MSDLSSHLAIVTGTLYNYEQEGDKERAELSVQTFQHIHDFGYEAYIIDGGSPQELVDEYRNLGVHVYVEPGIPMGKGRRLAISQAMETNKEVIAYFEPEKVDFVRLIEQCATPLLSNEADMVIPSRLSMKSFPTIQQYTEPAMNIFWRELTGNHFDMCFGPRVWRRELSSYFLDYDGEYGDTWDAIFIPVINAVHSGARVESISVDYTHPISQTTMEEHSMKFCMKRIDQLSLLTKVMEKHWLSLNA